VGRVYKGCYSRSKKYLFDYAVRDQGDLSNEIEKDYEQFAEDSIDETRSFILCIIYITIMVIII